MPARSTARRSAAANVRARPAKWINAFTYRDEHGVLWLTLLGAVKLGLPLVDVLNWGRGSCRFVEYGRKIDTADVGGVTVYRRADLRTIIRRRRDWGRKPRRVLYRDKDGPWLARCQLLRKYGRRGLTDAFFANWSDRESRLRPGEKALRSTEVVNALGRRGSGKLAVYCEKDVRNILAGREHRGLPVGAAYGAVRRTREREAVRWLRDQLAAGPGRCQDVKQRARQAGVSELLLEHALKALRVEWRREARPGGKGWWCRPGQSPPDADWQSQTREAILALLRARGPLPGARIAAELGRNRGTVKGHLLELKKKGSILGARQLGHGPWLWRLLDQPAPAAAATLPPALAQAYAVLCGRDPVTRGEFARLLGKNPNAAHVMLYRLKVQGLATCAGGRYAAAAAGEQRPNNGDAPDPTERTSARPPRPSPGGHSMEGMIVECLRANGCLQGQGIANKLGIPFNSYLRGILSGLAKRGVLAKVPHEGYQVV